MLAEAEYGEAGVLGEFRRGKHLAITLCDRDGAAGLPIRRDVGEGIDADVHCEGSRKMRRAAVPGRHRRSRHDGSGGPERGGRGRPPPPTL